MRITVKQTVESEMYVPNPLASKTDYGVYYILDEEGNLLKFAKSMVLKFSVGEHGHDRLVSEAVAANIVSMAEAQEKLAEVLSSFNVSNPSSINVEEAVC